MSLRHGVKSQDSAWCAGIFNEARLGILYGHQLWAMPYEHNFGYHTAVEVHRLHAQSLQVLAIQDKDWVCKTKI